MAAGARKDTYANFAYFFVTESAANTLTWAKLEIATGSLLDKKFGLLINRFDVEMYPYSILNSDGDTFTLGVSVSNSITDLSLSRPEVIMREIWTRVDYGAAASGILVDRLKVRDFSTMPGGGILVPADRLYIGAVGSGCGAVGNAVARMYYTVVELSSEDYWQLVESRRILSV